MMPLERVKELMGSRRMGDEEAAAIRDACHAWAELALEAQRRQRADESGADKATKKGARERA